jgi:hypothetical protein
MSFPIGDPQFWLATAAFALAAAWLLRGVLPAPWIGKKKPKGRRVNLTIGGRVPRK